MASQVVKYTNSNGKTTTASNTAYTSSYKPVTNRTYTNSDGSQYRADMNAYVRNPTLTTAPDRGNTPKTTTYYPPKTNNTGGGGGESYSAPAYSSGSDDVLNLIKSLLEQQQKAAEEAYKAQYEQQLAQNKLAWESNRNQINKNFMRGNRYLQNMYGDAISGTGLSNKARNYQNYQSNLASNQQNYTNNDASALAQFNQNKAGTYSTLANGWYNYVLPIYTNRQQTLDDYNYRRYLASL